MAKVEPGVVLVDDKNDVEPFVARRVVEAARDLLDDAVRKRERLVVASDDDGRRSRTRSARLLRRSEDAQTEGVGRQRNQSWARIAVILATVAVVAVVITVIRRRSQASSGTEPGAGAVAQHTTLSDPPPPTLIGEPPRLEADLDAPGG
jgi:hypothetical protein